MQRHDRDFELVGANLAGLTDAGVAIAASRAGATGLLNLEHEGDVATARAAVERLVAFGRGSRGVKLRAGTAVADALARDLPAEVGLVVLAGAEDGELGALADRVRRPGLRLFVECPGVEEARVALASGADGIVAKGVEAGGHVGEETCFILVQRLVRETDRPILAYGGIAAHTAPACSVAGCAGVVVDAQLALARESTPPSWLRAALERMEGDETTCVGSDIGDLFRAYERPGAEATEVLRQLEASLDHGDPVGARQRWRAALRERLGWDDPRTRLCPLGQDATFAAALARRYRTVGGILDGLRAAAVDHVTLARAQRALDRGAPLARTHGTDYPILQGPMTRVSDNADFAAAVGAAGALPFLALALMKGPQARTVLLETRERMGPRPWGVGVLGFVPPDLRQEQLEAIREVRPGFAIIAGGRPDQAARLEAEGIATYLHVPAPGLLRVFLGDGARRFVLEGRECGGHVGPRTSFVLWQSAIDTLLEAIDSGTPAGDLRVVFAGGIHDERSAAMVATIAAPLVARGAQVGVLLGTAYLFTEEAVTAGAIVDGFQEEALRGDRTVTLESGPGHTTRCLATPFPATFRQARRRLLAEGRPSEEVRSELEALNLGRLRIASKGLAREEPAGGEAPRHVEVDRERQHREGLYMIGQLASLRSVVGPVAALHEAVSTGSVAFLEERVPLPRPRARAPETRPAEIAIIGLGCRLPRAPDVSTFWANVLGKVDAITEVPRDRFDVDLYYHTDRKAPDRVYSRWGGFLDDASFDPLRYGIPPAALPSIDSTQLLALDVVAQALDDAGYLDREFSRERTAVVLGLSGGLGDLGLLYGVRANLPQLLDNAPPELLEQLPEWTEDSFAGILLNVAAGRVANRFDLRGANYTVDAACASSLAAVYLAASELESGTADMVVAGGIDTVQSPFGYLCFSTTQALSPRGRCRPFDASADGIVISEGLTMLVLKRLADAERDGDRVYAVIKGVGGSSDGRGKSLTAPRPAGQTAALRRAYARSGISPATVGLVEAHGTGTVVGDAAEVAALAEVYREAGAPAAGCAIGSVKSMIGHTKSAAGATGLMKVALALHHKVLPPTLHVDTPNPRLQDPESPFYAAVEARPWIQGRDDTPRRAAVSAFGFGGTNFHAVLEEHTGDFREPTHQRASDVWPAELLVWNGGDPGSLVSALRAVGDALERGARPRLRDLAAAIDEGPPGWGRGRSPLRLAVVATDLDDLRVKLATARQALESDRSTFEDPRGVFLRRGAGPEGRLAFLFPGQGSQAPHMLGELALHFPHIRRACEEADRVLASRLPSPLSSFIYPAPAFTEAGRNDQMTALTDTVIAQPALGAVEIGLLHLLRDLGLEPDMVGGHSYGEYVALTAAGVFSEADLYRVSEARGRAIKDSVGERPGTMAAVLAPAEAVREALRDLPEVWLANFNAPRQTIISGTPEGVRQATDALAAAGLRSQPIPVACAFHSPLMEGARERLASELARLTLAPPRLPVFSNTEAARYPGEAARIASLLSEQLVKPVRFVEEVKAMHQEGARVFLEVGPRGVLTGLVTRSLEGAGDLVALSLDGAGAGGMEKLLQGLARLFVAGVDLRLEPLFRGRSLRRAPLESLLEVTPAPDWVVSGSGARPAGRAPRPLSPIGLADASTPAAPPPARTPMPREPVPSRGTTATSPEAAPSPARASSPAASDTVLVQFQNLMSQFLQTQSSVMTAYLQGGAEVLVDPAGLTAPAATGPLLTPAPAEPPPAPPDVAPVAEVPAEAAEETDEEPDSPREEVGVALLRIVSERTGYPVAMLKPEAKIEADLGIDSIKRVEILSAFQQGCTPEERSRVQGVMDRLTSRPTLSDLIAVLDEALAAPPEASPVADSAPNTAEPPAPAELALPPREASPPASSWGEDLPRLTLTAVPAPARNGGPPRPGRVWLITDDETGLAERVAARLRDAGEAPVLLRHRPHPGDPGPQEGIVEGDLARVDEVERLVDDIRRRGGSPGGLVHLLPLRGGPPFDALSLDGWRERVRTDIKSLYALLRTTGPDLSRAGAAGGAMVVAATAMAASFQRTASEAPPTHGGVTAFLKTVATEMPDVTCRVVHLDPARPADERADLLLTEIGTGDGPLEVGYVDGRRLTVVPRHAPLSSGTNGLEIGSDWVFLVTGGARGITAEICAHLALAFRPTLVLAGRTPLPGAEDPETVHLADPTALRRALTERLQATRTEVTPAEVESAWRGLMRDREIRANLEALERAGTRVEYHAVDVRDEAAFGGLIDDIYRDHGRLDAVIHGAGIIEDKLLRDKTEESFDRVVGTKADGAFILARHLRPEGLKLLAFMSSVTATFGNRGQADYGAANGVLNDLAGLLSARWAARVCALNWGPWGKTGMVSEAVKVQFARRGIQVIPLQAGVAAAARELQAAEAEAVVVFGGGPWVAEAAHQPEATGVGA